MRTFRGSFGLLAVASMSVFLATGSADATGRPVYRQKTVMRGWGPWAPGVVVGPSVPGVVTGVRTGGVSREFFPEFYGVREFGLTPAARETYLLRDSGTSSREAALETARETAREMAKEFAKKRAELDVDAGRTGGRRPRRPPPLRSSRRATLAAS